MRIVVSAGLAALVITGCATITTGQNQPVSVETPGCAGATCKLSNDKGTWFVSATPGSATVQRAYGDMTVTCEKGDYRSSPYLIKSSTKGMAFGNIVFGGLIGAAVDAGSGAAYDYPTLITVSIVCSGDPKTVIQPTQPLEAPAPNAAPPENAAPPQQNAVATPAVIEHKQAPVDQTVPVKLVSPALSTSKHMFAAERTAKALGCERPVATMNIQTATAESFTVHCSGRDPLSIRCENGECHELK